MQSRIAITANMETFAGVTALDTRSRAFKYLYILALFIHHEGSIHLHTPTKSTRLIHSQTVRTSKTTSSQYPKSPKVSTKSPGPASPQWQRCGMNWRRVFAEQWECIYQLLWLWSPIWHWCLGWNVHPIVQPAGRTIALRGRISNSLASVMNVATNVQRTSMASTVQTLSVAGKWSFYFDTYICAYYMYYIVSHFSYVHFCIVFILVYPVMYLAILTMRCKQL